MRTDSIKPSTRLCECRVNNATKIFKPMKWAAARYQNNFRVNITTTVAHFMGLVVCGYAYPALHSASLRFTLGFILTAYFVGSLDGSLKLERILTMLSIR